MFKWIKRFRQYAKIYIAFREFNHTNSNRIGILGPTVKLEPIWRDMPDSEMWMYGYIVVLRDRDPSSSLYNGFDMLECKAIFGASDLTEAKKFAEEYYAERRNNRS